MIYHKLKVRSNKNRNPSLSEVEINVLSECQPYDSQLFKEANRVLEKKIERIGYEIFRPLLFKFQNCIQYIENECKYYSTDKIQKSFPFQISSKGYHQQPISANHSLRPSILCNYFKLDNRDLVSLFWRYDLHPPREISTIVNDILRNLPICDL